MNCLSAVFALPAVALACGSVFWFDTLPRDTDEPWVNLPVVEYDFENQVDACYCGMDIRVTVRRGDDGRVETLVRGESVSPRELLWKLLVFAERKRDMEHPLQPSEVGVIIRADRDLPWWAVRRVLDACQDPDVRIYKIGFNVWSSSR